MSKSIPRLTTTGGAPVADNQNSLTAGPRGPVLLQDVHLIEKLAHQNRERISPGSIPITRQASPRLSGKPHRGRATAAWRRHLRRLSVFLTPFD